MSSPQDKAQQLIAQLDKEVCIPTANMSDYTAANSYLPPQLSKYPALVNLEKSTSVPKAYSVIGLVTLYFFLIVFNLGGQLLTNVAGFVIPGYYSLDALFTANKHDDTQWLTVSCNAPFTIDDLC